MKTNIKMATNANVNMLAYRVCTTITDNSERRTGKRIPKRKGCIAPAIQIEGGPVFKYNQWFQNVCVLQSKPTHTNA